MIACFGLVTAVCFALIILWCMVRTVGEGTFWVKKK